MFSLVQSFKRGLLSPRISAQANLQKAPAFLVRKMSLASTLEKPVHLAVIGGTGLYKLDTLKVVSELNPETPWGFPSSPITICETDDGHRVAFLARHGLSHQHSPSEVPALANIAALKAIGVRAIVAYSAVGSLRQEIAPEDFVLPNQIIDRTKGIRPSTYFGNGVVGHAVFGDPFDAELRNFVHKHSATALQNAKWHTPKSEDDDLTVVCMEGPAFSTRAESRMYRQLGGDVINMSVLPEAKLAREAEIAYQMICMSTDYDAWRTGEEPVTVAAVLAHLAANSANAHRVAEAFVGPLARKLDEDSSFLSSLNGSMGFSVTKPEARSAETVEKLQYLHPKYYE